MRLRRAAILLPIYIALLASSRAVSFQPAGPPYPVSHALATFRIADGFQIEPFAAEPLVASPVAMEIDERGRMFVVEMPGYPLDVSGTGRVTLLSDSDGDGRPDRSTIFADRLRLPTGIMKWKNGVLVTDSPQVWYFEDADGDGKAEIKREILTGFALSNPQHTTNAPIYGLDNWIYLANEGPVRTIRYRDIFGDAGGEIRFPDRPAAPRLPPDADGRNVRFRPDTSELEMLSSRSQFGHTFDAWGRHFLVTHNRHISHEVIAARYLARNPALVVPSAVEHIPDYPLPAALFPITRNPEYQLLTDLGVMTSASGLTYYLAELFPAEYHNAAFVAEGAHNLVHVVTVRDHGATFRASRMFDGREFLASTDAWFRPVNFYLGPDGALYVIDYYRKILEHPEWMADAAAASKEVSLGHDRGRIYRIAPKGAPRPNWLDRIRLAESSPEELVQALARPNVWWRRHAQRLLVDRRPQEVAARLASMAVGSESPVARLHALWTLQGLGRLEPSVIAQALRDRTAGVRENAIRLAELQSSAAPSLVQELLRLVSDPDPRVRFQLLLTLGDLETPESVRARTDMLFDNLTDDWMQVAALSASALDVSTLLHASIERAGAQESVATRTLFTRIGSVGATAGDVSVVRKMLETLLSPAAGASIWWRSATLSGIAAGLPAKRRRMPELEPERLLAADRLAGDPPAAMRRALLTLVEAVGLPSGPKAGTVLERAARLAEQTDAEPEVRADAIRLLAIGGTDRSEPLLTSVLARAEPAAVHIAAVRALGDLKGDRASTLFLKLWDRWTPSVRDEALRALVREPERVRALLDAIGAGRVRTSEIEWPLRVRMMMSDDEGLRTKARALFGRPATDERTIVARYRAALSRSGDIDRGRRVFSRSCATCHQYRGSGGVMFGPDLGEVRGRLPAAILDDILRPNQSIADGYELWVADLAAGSTISGTIGAETPTSVTFRHAGGGETTVARVQIAAMRIAPMSAMPERLDAHISVQDMADLIAFIKGGR